MLRKSFGAAAIAAAVFALAPAQAAHVRHHHVAHVGVGCSADNFAKAEGEVETMADSPGKFMAEREIAEAQDEMLGGKMSGCAIHLSRALRDESAAQGPYQGAAPFAGPAAPAPVATQGTPSQWNWMPMQGAY